MGDGSVLRRTGGTWTQVLEHRELRLGRGNPLYGVAAKSAPIPLVRGLERLPALPGAYSSALWASDPSDVWIGGTGFLAHWHEGKWTGADDPR